jgi:hypothetical protein
MVTYSPVKYDAKFCALIGANPNSKYSKTNIFNILITHAKKTYRNFEFTGEIKDFLQKIHHPGWNGYRKTTIMQMLSTLMTSSGSDLSSKYVVISANKSTVPVTEVEIVL